MKRATFNLLFIIRKGSVKKNGTYTIFARITVNGERVEFSINASVLKKHWDKKTMLVKPVCKDAIVINDTIMLIRTKLYNYKLQLQEEGINLTALALKNKYLGIIENPRTILSIFKEHNERCKTLVNIDFAPGTYERYETCYKHVSNFIKHKLNKDDVLLNEVKPQFINDLEHYLKVDRKCNHNTTTKYLKNFKKITRIALANDWMKKDPFSNIKFHLKEVDIAFLTEEELNTIMYKKLSTIKLDQVRDIYVFQCFTGLAFIDVKRLSKNHIVYHNGSSWIKKRRHKTKNWSHIPLMEPAIDILKKYEKFGFGIETDEVLPVLSNQKMNEYIKVIAKECEINKNLSTHTARHTFATTVTLANKISIEVVSKMLGHSSINMTKKYARVVDDVIQKDMKKLQGKYCALKVSKAG